ncbi:MAG TPA: YciI family protein [Candidatus Udaeobacter sp.]|nr:YciI family protein [Candidatus Udaeobacter sp.]
MNTQPQNGYMLLFRSDEWYEELSYDEIQKVISQNNAWIEELTAQGKAKPGHALQRKGATVSGKNGRIVSDGPFAEPKEAIGGYLILNVETLEEAIAIAKSSPNLAYGTSIEVRPVAEECPVDVRARELAREEQLVTG